MATNFAASARPVEGNASSPVRVLIYEDLQCADCLAFAEMLDEHLLPRYGFVAAFEHRDFPLPKHSWARDAAIAACFFDEQTPGMGLRFRRAAMAQIDDVNGGTFADFLADFASENQVDPMRAAAALSDARYKACVEASYQEGVMRGVKRTPTVFVMDQPFIERFDPEAISQAIEFAIEEARR
ncbi:MAG: thioredoxin domain-containing protein [Bryobacteraceae bacterium]